MHASVWKLKTRLKLTTQTRLIFDNFETGKMVREMKTFWLNSCLHKQHSNKWNNGARQFRVNLYQIETAYTYYQISKDLIYWARVPKITFVCRIQRRVLQTQFRIQKKAGIKSIRMYYMWRARHAGEIRLRTYVFSIFECNK